MIYGGAQAGAVGNVDWQPRTSIVAAMTGEQIGQQADPPQVASLSPRQQYRHENVLPGSGNCAVKTLLRIPNPLIIARAQGVHLIGPH